VRPSGTEPKIKYYFFAQSPCDHPDRLAAVKRDTEETLRGLEKAVVAWVDQVVPEA
jgi:phosphoglucomutase/phosphomannomutase